MKPYRHISGEKTNRNVNSRKNLDILSFQLHNVVLSNPDDIQDIEDLLKTYNSISRCAFKRFKSIGLKGMLNGHRTPDKREVQGKFTNYMYMESPDGMSDELWFEFRKGSYDRKRNEGLKNANQFWQIDKDLGSPISGTIKSLGEWAKKNDYTIDSVLTHNAVMQGLKTYKSFIKKQSKWMTDKANPVFGDMVSRSRKKISKSEFNLSKNSSFTVTGSKAKNGNPKFKFNLEDSTVVFTLRRKKITFSYNHNRFSKAGYDKFQELVNLMNDSKMPVTVTLTEIQKGKFTITLSYSPIEFNQLTKKPIHCDKNISCGIYVTDNSLCHQIVNVNTNKVIYSRIYDIDELSGLKRNKHAFETLKWNGQFKELAKLNKRIKNTKWSETTKILNTIFNVNKSFHVKNVVVEKPSSRTIKNFNNSYISFNKISIGSKNCRCNFISSTRFNDMVKSHCLKNNMTFNKVNGSFIQLNAILDSNSMSDALKNACNSLIYRFHNPNALRLTDLRKKISNPSMLDWIGHLLHNKRSRQARMSIRETVHNRLVEKANRLLDNRFKCIGTEDGRHSTSF